MINKLKNFVFSPNSAYILAGLMFIWFLTRHWLSDGFILGGHDSGLALNAKEFLQTRLFAWDEQNFGSDNSPHFGSLTLHFIDYIGSIIADVPYAGNQILVFFWLSAIFLSAYIFARELSKKTTGLVKYLFPIFISINFFILQPIFILERAKYSVLVAILLFLTILFKYQAGSLSLLTASILAGFGLTVFNSGSLFGLPLYGSLLVIILVIIFTSFANTWKWSKFKDSKNLISFLCLTFLLTILFNSYSLFPYAANFFSKDINLITSENVIAPNRAWLDSMSNATSLLNIFRLQGVPDWYASNSDVNTAHQYADEYLKKPLLVGISFLFPILAFLGFLIRKNKKTRETLLLFAVVTLISMFFVAGTHEPLGSIYALLYERIPGFSIFRSPYYKFGTAYFLGILTLLAISLSLAINKLVSLIASRGKQKLGMIINVNLLKTFFVLVVICGWLGYHYIIFQPDKLFTWQPGLSTKIKVPPYVSDFNSWLDSNKQNESRTLLIPPVNEQWKNDAYNWGYWSLSPLFSVLSSKSFITGDSNLSDEERAWVNMLYNAITDGDQTKFLSIANGLNVGNVLIRKDVLSDNSWSSLESYKDYEGNIVKFSQVKNTSSLGQWDLYTIKNDPQNTIRSFSSFASVPKNRSYLGREFLTNADYLFSDDIKLSPQLEKYISNQIEGYTCQSCLLEQKASLSSLPAVRILPNSPLYRLKIAQEERSISKPESNEQLLDFYLGYLLRRMAEVKTMLDTDIDENYIVTDLKVVNSYLDEIYLLLPKIAEPKNDFYRTKEILDILNPIEKYLRNFVSLQEFGFYGEELRQQTFGVLWRINKMENYFSPLLEDSLSWSNQKIYFLNFTASNMQNLYLRKNTLPKNTDGSLIPPFRIIYGDSKSQELPIKDHDFDWYKIVLKDVKNGSGKLKLEFENLPNLYSINSSKLEDFPTGTRACYVGSISQFNPNRAYRVEASSTYKEQALRLIFKESNRTSPTHGYLHGEDETDVIFTQPGEPYNYIYYPSKTSTYSNVYLCTGNKKLPVDVKINIFEIFSPELVSNTTKNITEAPPKIAFQKINATKYTVKIEDSKEPFMLGFNQRFSPLWRINNVTEENSQNWLSKPGLGLQPNHFHFNGDTNGWWIEKPGTYTLDIEYLPQKFFYLGSVITISSLLLALGILATSLLGRKQAR